jgi:hypothetical protein
LPYPLKNVGTLDGYDDTRTTLFPPRPVHKVTVTVLNATAFVQFERCDNMRVGGGVLLPEELWIPGVHSVTREFLIGRVRFRSGVTGVPAQISANATGS